MSAKKGYPTFSERIPPGWRVANSDRWPINNPNPPGFKMEDWRLRTYGEVDNPLELSFEDFQHLPHISKILDHHCVDGWSYLGQNWNGVDISVIKERSLVRSSVRYLIVESIKGGSQRFPIDQDLLLADAQSGSPLSRAAGYPVRVVAPGEFGFKSRKWVGSIKFCSGEERDSLEEAFDEAGVYDLYSTRVGPLNPWNVDSTDRKKFLRTIFTADRNSTRISRKEQHLKASRGITPVGGDIAELCKVEALEKSRTVKAVVNGNEVLLLNSGGNIFAIEPICTHLGTDLSGGKFNPDAGTLRCPLHGALFDVGTGKCLSGSMGCDGDTFPDARTYKIIVNNGSVFLVRNQDWGALW
jgi:DMSO/TMAO reductase YedYZ molybdopterin-dependent catalytic subunit/nitrite reductase/ring-hydroxylating ferredoxin subunit